LREGMQINGVNTGAMQSRLDDLALVLGNPLFSGLARFVPCLYSKRCVKDSETHRCTNYFLEDFTRITSCAFDAVSTQSSRKFGHGA